MLSSSQGKLDHLITIVIVGNRTPSQGITRRYGITQYPSGIAGIPGSTDDRTWEEYIGEDESDALQFYTDILLIEDILSIIESEDEI